MKSAQFNRYGGSEVIEINQNTPEPTLTSGKVLVSIKAAGVNPADWKIREGTKHWIIKRSADSNSWWGRRYRINCHSACQVLGSIRRDNSKCK